MGRLLDGVTGVLLSMGRPLRCTNGKRQLKQLTRGRGWGRPTKSERIKLHFEAGISGQERHEDGHFEDGIVLPVPRVVSLQQTTSGS
jgi:hypothetical protein